MTLNEQNIESELEKFNLKEYLKEKETLEKLTSKIVKEEPVYIEAKKSIGDIREEYITEKKSETIKKKEVEKKINKYVDGFDLNFFNSFLNELKKEEKSSKSQAETSLLGNLKSLRLFGAYEIEGNNFTLNVAGTKMTPGVYSTRTYKGDIQEINVPIPDANHIDTSLINHFVDEFITLVEELAVLHNKDEFKENNNRVIKRSLFETKNNLNKRIKYEIEINKSILDDISTKNEHIFILASKKNILDIINSYSHINTLVGETNVYFDSHLKDDYDFISNDKMGDTVVIGKCPLEEDSGINLIFNKNTLHNYTFSEEDINGVNLAYGFYACGEFPHNSYLSFKITD